MLVSKHSESVLLNALIKSSELIQAEAEYSSNPDAKLAYQLIAEMLQHASFRKESPLLNRLQEYTLKGPIKTNQELSREYTVYCALSAMLFFNKSQHAACKLASKHTDCSTDILRKKIPTFRGEKLKQHLEEERYEELLFITMQFQSNCKKLKDEKEAGFKTVVEFAKMARAYMEIHKQSEANEKEINRLLFCDDEDTIDSM